MILEHYQYCKNGICVQQISFYRRYISPGYTTACHMIYSKVEFQTGSKVVFDLVSSVWQSKENICEILLPLQGATTVNGLV